MNNDWQVVTESDRRQYPAHTDRSIRGIKLIDRTGTIELFHILEDEAKLEELRLKVGTNTNPRWVKARIFQALYDCGEISHEEMTREELNRDHIPLVARLGDIQP